MAHLFIPTHCPPTPFCSTASIKATLEKNISEKNDLLLIVTEV